jgi:hypothetical protein
MIPQVMFPDERRYGSNGLPGVRPAPKKQRGRQPVLGLPCLRCEGATQVLKTGRAELQILEPNDRKQYVRDQSGLLAMVRRRRCKECSWTRHSFEFWLPEGVDIERFDEEQKFSRMMRRRKGGKPNATWLTKPIDYIRMFVEVRRKP